ncbi:MAG: BamA/TamA family outer membrane protein [Chitinispirillaceae bacterium]|nr:BamA/TamA family outer membrane protein [Chitinispirillaceae bacterium]
MHHLIIFLICVVSVSAVYSSESFIQIDSSRVTFGQKKIDGISFRKLRSDLKGLSRGEIQSRLARIGDSLGYFNSHFDTLTEQTVVFYPGARSIIADERIFGLDSAIAAGLPVQRYPFRYDAFDIKNRAGQIVRALTDNGYPYAKVTVDLLKHGNSTVNYPDTFSLYYKAFPDERCVNAEPLLKGVQYCKPRLIYNDISVHAGDLYDLRKQLQSVQRLKMRPYIVDVTIDEPALEKKQYSPDNPASVVVPFQIVDKSGLGVDGAAGVVKNGDQKAELSGSLRLSLLNVFHIGESSELGYTGDKSQQLFNFSITKPWLLNLPMEISTGGGLEVIKEQYGYIYGNLKLLTEIGMQWQAGIDIKGNETTVSADSVGVSGHFYGAAFVISRRSGTIEQGVFSHNLYLEAGRGVSRKEKRYTRTSLQFNAGIHLPFLMNQGVLTNVFWYHAITKEEKLVPSEMYRIGANTTMRGYGDNELALRTAFHGQVQYMFYLNKFGAVYAFSDGGIGSKNKPGSRSDYITMMGYGLGLRLPSRIGTVILEWARNIDDTRNPGRIHIRYSGGVR